MRKYTPRRGGGGPNRGRGNRSRANADRNSEPVVPSTQTTERKRAEIPANITVKDLATTLDLSPMVIIRELLQNGVMSTINQSIDFDTASLVAGELGFDLERSSVEAPAVDESKAVITPEELAAMVERPPIVTIMGHVDHGKTSLLDAIRETKVTESEQGGITQHIGAYQVDKDGKKITFLDTPGHAAFTAMRARGAEATDVAIVVVAADDGVMPQTLEAINHARSARVPLIIAINKIDRPDANPDRVKQQLSDAGVLVEEWGGDTVSVPVSAKKREGIDQLLEMILLVAEMAELKANPKRIADGVVIEAKLDKARGPLATVLVKNGTLRTGDYLVVGGSYGRVRAMFNDRGKTVKRAEPSTPVEILGIVNVPEAGDSVQVVTDEKTARARAHDETLRRQALGTQLQQNVSLEQLFSKIEEGQAKDLNLILKTDVQGSIDPLHASLERLSTDEVHVHIIHEGIGNVTENDILLAVAGKAVIIGFNVNVEAGAAKRAETDGVDVRLYSVIYNVIEEVQNAITGMLEPVYEDVLEGRAEVRQVFRVSRMDAIAGCYVLEGKVARSATARIIRGREEVHRAKLSGLRRFKDDVREVVAGFECGISVDGFTSFEVGDLIEAYTRERVN